VRVDNKWFRDREPGWMSNVVKHGNVIPLKIRVVDPGTGTTLSVSLGDGILKASDVEDGTALLAPTESVGAHYRWRNAIRRQPLHVPPGNEAARGWAAVHHRHQGARHWNLVTTAVIGPKKN
jgi:hypothetical protein